MQQIAALRREYRTLKGRMRVLRSFVMKSYLRAISTKDSMDYDNIMIIAPHPDDEAIGCGGLISLSRARRRQVSVVCVSDGEAAHSGCCNISTEKLGLIRRRLAVGANSIMGVDESNITWLNLSDGEIPDTHCPDFKQSCNLMVQSFLRINPRVVVAPHPMDLRPDHIATSHLIQAAIAIHGKPIILYYYPIWLFLGARLRDFLKLSQLKVVSLDIGPVIGAKKEAMKYYLQDINPICGRPYSGQLPPDFVKLFQGPYELFFTGR